MKKWIKKTMKVSLVVYTLALILMSAVVMDWEFLTAEKTPAMWLVGLWFVVPGNAVLAGAFYLVCKFIKSMTNGKTE